MYILNIYFILSEKSDLSTIYQESKFFEKCKEQIIKEITEKIGKIYKFFFNKNRRIIISISLNYNFINSYYKYLNGNGNYKVYLLFL